MIRKDSYPKAWFQQDFDIKNDIKLKKRVNIVP